jgi:hypothetical protein
MKRGLLHVFAFNLYVTARSLFARYTKRSHDAAGGVGRHGGGGGGLKAKVDAQGMKVTATGSHDSRYDSLL